MPFESSDAYRIFADSVKHDRRFIYDRRVNQFLDAVAETSSTRMEMLKAGSKLWRAQLGSRWDVRDKGTPEEMEVEIPYFEDRMKPLPSLVTDGRANPRGIAYLYLADSETTAGSELRPWLGASISMSRFLVHRDLKIVDCTSDKKRWPFKGFNAEMTGTVPWGPEEYESVVWGDIADAMSTPHNPEQVSLNYVPTQVISERLRHGGADGIAYRSLLARGERTLSCSTFRTPIRLISSSSKQKRSRIISRNSIIRTFPRSILIRSRTLLRGLLALNSPECLTIAQDRQPPEYA